MSAYQFQLTGISPLIMHCDDVEKADELMEWRKAPANKNLSKPGDDRSPPWTWKTYCYSDGEHITIPRDNLMTCLRTAATRIKIKGNKSFKSESQSGLFITDAQLKLEINDGDLVSVADITAIDGTFAEHKEAAQRLGFDLFVKRAKVGNSKHIRVRPIFQRWSIRGEVEVSLPEITGGVLDQMFELAGRYAGLCDWRPSSPQSPGSYGLFESLVEAVKEKKAA